LSYQVVQVHVPSSYDLQRTLTVLREVVDFDFVNRAGKLIMQALVRYALEVGILRQSQPYGVVVNRPDAEPLQAVFQANGLTLCPIEVKTARRGSDNARVVEKAKNVAEEWPRNGDTSLIVDSCIARGTTYVECFAPIIQDMSRSVSTIVYFILIASEPGLMRIDETSKGLFKRVHIVTATVDKYVDERGWIVPGVGPDSFTKRIPEKMGTIEIWSEYPLDLARLAFARSLGPPHGWTSALDASLLWLTWLFNRNRGGPISYSRLVEWVQLIDSISGLHGTEHSIAQQEVAYPIGERPFSIPRRYNVSSALDRLGFQELVQHTGRGYVLNPNVGQLYLGEVCISVMENDPLYGTLADSIERFYPKLP